MVDDIRHMEYKDNFVRLQNLVADLPIGEGHKALHSIEDLAADIDIHRECMQDMDLHRHTSLLHKLRAYLVYKNGCDVLASMLADIGPVITTTSGDNSFECMAATIERLTSDHRINIQPIQRVYAMLLAYRSSEEQVHPR